MWEMLGRAVNMPSPHIGQSLPVAKGMAGASGDATMALECSVIVPATRKRHTQHGRRQTGLVKAIASSLFLSERGRVRRLTY